MGDTATTVTFDPSCDGSFEIGGVARWDFSYTFSDPRTADSQRYIASTSNAELYREGGCWMWKPMVGGASLAETTPGVVTFHFSFERPITGALTNTAQLIRWQEGDPSPRFGVFVATH